jgi:predicted dehydrogenase
MTLRAAILGCGGIAVRHADAVAATTGIELVAACSRDLARAQAFAAARGAIGYADLDAMIDAGLDLLIITTPPFARDGEAEHAAARGVHLLVEKPIALDLAIANRMVAAVEASGVIAAIGYMYRFGDAIRAWQGRDVGRTGMFSGEYHCHALHADWWRSEAKSGGQILEQAIHQIDLIRHMIGDPDIVYARRANLLHGATPGYDVEDVSAMLFGYADGRIATLAASNIATPGLWFKRWSIMAEKMTGRFSDWNAAEFLPAEAGATPELFSGNTDVFAAQIADLSAAIIENRQPAIPLREGLGSLRLALAAKRSAAEGRVIEIADVV